MAVVPVPLRSISLPRSVGFTHEALLKKQADDLKGGFGRGYQLHAVSEGSRTFPHFEDCYGFGAGLGDLQRNDWPAVIGVDPGSKARPGWAIVGIKVDPSTFRRYPAAIEFGAWKIQQGIEALSRMDALLNPLVIVVEDNGVQEWFEDIVDYLKLSWWAKIEPLTTGLNKRSLEIGLPSLNVEFRHRAWAIPQEMFDGHPPNHHQDDCAWCRWVYEFTNYPTAATTDGVMATWFARRGITLAGLDLPPAENDIPSTNR